MGDRQAREARRGLYRSSTIGCRHGQHDAVYGNAFVLLDANTGALRGVELQDRQPIGLRLSDWLFALHFGAIRGWPMQVFICVMGPVIAMLSVTGIYLWWKKRRVRLARLQAASCEHPQPTD